MKVTLEVTFRMGGVDFRGHRWDGDTLVFEFERRGDAYIQVLSDRKVEVEVEKRPKKWSLSCTQRKARKPTRPLSGTAFTWPPSFELCSLSNFLST